MSNLKVKDALEKIPTEGKDIVIMDGKGREVEQDQELREFERKD